MTKAELVRKLARRAGVSDNDAKMFFEIFLQKAAYLLNPGEAINIKGFGFFQLKKAKLRKDDKYVREDEVLPELITYSELNLKSDDADELLIFNIPAQDDEGFNVVDTYFSLSIGKPVIPIKGVKSPEFFVPPTVIELRRLLETKVENLLSRTELIKNYTKGSEYLVLSPDNVNTNQFEINWNEVSENESYEHEMLSWDFGDEISKQIEEDSLLDLGKIDTESNETESLSWDFGDEYNSDYTSLPDAEPSILEEPAEKMYSQENKAEDIIPEPKNFSRLTHLTKEQNINESSADTGEWKSVEEITSEKKEKDVFQHYDDSFVDKDGYTAVPNKRRTYDIELSSHEQAKLDSLIKEELAKEDDSDTTDAAIDFYKDDLQIDSIELPKEEPYSKKRSTLVFIIALGVIVLVGAALYFYLRNSALLNPVQKNVAGTVKTPASTVVIEREYDVPVNYPYNKKEESGINIPSIQGSTDTSTTAKQPEEEGVSSLPAGVETKIKENLYKTGNTYFVQVSAWDTEQKAESVAKKIRNNGFAAFVEKTSIQGNTKYRVKVRDFKNQSDAEQFLNNYKD